MQALIKYQGDLSVNPISKMQKGIESHRKAANHLQLAAKNHLRAAMHYEEGNHEKAALSTVVALGHVNLANKAQNKIAKLHVTKS